MMLGDVKVGEPFLARNLLVVPLFGQGGGPKAITMHEALGNGIARFSETGNVEQAILDYGGERPLFLMDGEEIVGAMQNRVLNTAVLAVRGRWRLPVSCVEEGRWSGGRSFRSGGASYPSLRAILADSVHRSLRAGRGHRSDQAKVWSSVKTKLTSLRVSSRTMSMHDAYTTLREELLAYSEGAEMEGACGMAAWAGGKFLGLDLFASPELFAKLRAKLLEGYALDAMTQRGMTGLGIPDELSGVLSSIREARWEDFPGVVVGVDKRARDRNLVMRALVHRDTVVSLSAFPAPL